MTSARIAYWKEVFEQAWRDGDRELMVEAEKHIESWRMWDGLAAEEQEALLGKHRQEAQ